MIPIVIIVDDEVAIHKIINISFRREIKLKKFKVLSFLNGDECLKYLTEHPEDRDSAIIFSDINMPILDGIDLAKKVTELEPNLKFHLLSASTITLKELAEQGLESIKIFRKPISMDIIKDEIYRITA